MAFKVEFEVDSADFLLLQQALRHYMRTALHQQDMKNEVANLIDYLHWERVRADRKTLKEHREAGLDALATG